MMQFSQKFAVASPATELVIRNNGTAKGPNVCTRNFGEMVWQLAIDGLNAETWSVAVQPMGGTEYKTPASGLAKTVLYGIPRDTIFQAIKVTLSGGATCTVILNGIPQPARNYG